MRPKILLAVGAGVLVAVLLTVLIVRLLDTDPAGTATGRTVEAPQELEPRPEPGCVRRVLLESSGALEK